MSKTELTVSTAICQRRPSIRINRVLATTGSRGTLKAGPASANNVASARWRQLGLMIKASCCRVTRAVETLIAGDLVATLDHGPLPMRWTCSGEYRLEAAADASADGRPAPECHTADAVWSPTKPSL